MLNRLLNLDRELLVFLNGLGNETFDAFWIAATQGTTWIPLFVFFAFLIFRNYPLKEAWLMIGTAVLLLFAVLGLTLAAKSGFARIRPNENLQVNRIIRVLTNPGGFSFFSGHASSSFSLTTLMICYLRNTFSWRYLFIIWPLFFTLSRIYVGVHYPIDLLVGALVGTLSGLLFYRMYKDVILPYIQSGHRE
ncbi:MAG: hypothetical protein RLZZ241_1629 [Bacteroidota bacterium]|jgi:undecaprenyl-diphosphatase